VHFFKSTFSALVNTEYIERLRINRGGVYMPSQLECTLLVMVNRVKGGGVHPPSSFYHLDGMYARQWPLPLCEYSVLMTVHAKLVSRSWLKHGVPLQNKSYFVVNKSLTLD
jgi:hypothetical protein